MVRRWMILNENFGIGTPFQGSDHIYLPPQCVALGWLGLPFQGVERSIIRHARVGPKAISL